MMRSQVDRFSSGLRDLEIIIGFRDEGCQVVKRRTERGRIPLALKMATSNKMLDIYEKDCNNRGYVSCKE
jgi:hypothetical protein